MVSNDGQDLSFEAGPETLARTNLGSLVLGSLVNVEPSLRVGDAMGGHFVTGHIDGSGTLSARQDDRDWSTFWFTVDARLTRQMASKGSVAVDGVSLTLVEVEGERFSVALIPHTLESTTLGGLKAGDVVNIETDVLAKYVEKSQQRAMTPLPGSHHQTISFLTHRFAEVGIEPRTRHGQNFLIDLNLIRLLVDAANLTTDDVVLEVGTGTGSLTALLAAQAAGVITVEIDSRLHQLASEELFGVGNVIMLLQDALKNKNTLDAGLLATIAQSLQQHPNSRFKLVANLPYNIATPILSNLLECPTPPVSMTATIQKELADRILASPGTKDYGALSIWIQSQCRVQLVCVLPPSVFWPRPKVTSAIVHIDRDDQLRGQIVDLAFFHQFVRSLFFHRRKLLRSVLSAGYKDQLSKANIDALLTDLGLSPDSRAEQLDVPTVIRLSDAIRPLIS